MEKLSFNSDIINAIYEQATKKPETMYEKIQKEFDTFKCLFFDKTNIANGCFTYNNRLYTYFNNASDTASIGNTDDEEILDMILDVKSWTKEETNALLSEYGPLKLLGNLNKISNECCFYTIDDFFEDGVERYRGEDINSITSFMIIRYIIQTDVLKIRT
jgi:hypothetical protein